MVVLNIVLGRADMASGTTKAGWGNFVPLYDIA